MSDYYSLDDLKWVGVLEFTSIPTGHFYRARNGKMKEETVGIEYVRTVGAGRLPLDQWYKHAVAAINREGLTGLYGEIRDYVYLHCAWLHTVEAVKQYAAKCLVNGSYQKWEDFGACKKAAPAATGTARK